MEMKKNPFPSCILIDLESQKLFCYVENELIIETPIVSGQDINNSRTKPGYFHIFEKVREMDFAHYWIAFNAEGGGSGIHDNLYRGNDLSQFGGDIFRENGTDGCIHVPLDVAGQLFDICWTGMPVVIESSL